MENPFVCEKNNKLIKKENFSKLSLIISFFIGISVSYLHFFSNKNFFNIKAYLFTFPNNSWRDFGFFGDYIISDFFSAITPIGYQIIYKLSFMIFNSGAIINFCLPILLLTGISYYSNKLGILVTNSYKKAFLISLTCLLFSIISLEAISFSPKSFCAPFFLAFLYYFATQNIKKASFISFILSLLYPMVGAVCFLGLVLASIKDRSILTKNKNTLKFFLIFTSLSIFSILIFSYKTTDFRTILSYNELLNDSFHNITGKNILEFFTTSPETSFFAKTAKFLFKDFFVGKFLFTLIFLSFSIFIFIKAFWPDKTSQKYTKIAFFSTILSSAIFYILSSLVVFVLYLPNRYLEPVFLLCLPFAFFKIINIKKNWFILACLFLIFCIGFSLKTSFTQSYKTYKPLPNIVDYLKKTPKKSVIASNQKIFFPITNIAYRKLFYNDIFKNDFFELYRKEIRKRKKINNQIFSETKIGKLSILLLDNDISFIITDTNSLNENSYLKKTPKACKLARDKRLTLISSNCLINRKGSKTTKIKKAF